MDLAREKRLNGILEASSELTAEEQEAYLAEACRDDPVLLEEARRRLKVSSQPTEIFDLSSAVEAAELRHTERDLLGSTIGTIRLTELLGEGGMGKVYLGYDEKLKRGVAVKSIRPEHALSLDVKGRFLQEAQILSSLQHPNICQIYDYVEGDDTDFLVLELIEGQSLDVVIPGNVDEVDRMRFALQIADVLVAAHTKGVIHRDLKPANVMVATDGDVKVLDFGIARSMTEDEINDTLSGIEGAADSLAEGSTATSFRTKAGSILGTLQYMSPEQAQGERATPASDMFSYGLLIQEVFTGKACYDMVRGRPLVDVLEGRTLPAVGLEPELTALIDRLKSVAPGARPSATDTAARLRWIEAAPARRRRRRLKMVAVAGLALVTVLMTVLSFLVYQQARIARREAESTRQVLDFLVELFEVSNPSEARGEAITAREILDRGATRITRELRDEPVIRARLLDSIGTIYQKIGLKRGAGPLLEEALEIRQGALGEDHPQVAESLDHVAMLYMELGRFEEADALSLRALGILEKTYGSEHEEVAKNLDQRAVLHAQQGKYEAAEALFQRALAIRDGGSDSEPRYVAQGLTNLAFLYEEQGRFEDAEGFHRRALGILEELAADQPELAQSLNGLAIVYDRQGRHAEALPLYERALAISEKALDPEHPDIATTVMNLASLHANMGEHDTAEALYRRALEGFEKAFGPDHPRMGEVTGNFANLAIKQGNFTEAEALYRRALGIFEKALGPEHPAVAACQGGIGGAYLIRRRFEEAEPFYQSALAIFEKALGSQHPEVARTADSLAFLYAKTERYGEAKALAERAVAIAEGTFGPDHQVTALYRATWADVERRRGELEAAETALVESRAALEAALGEEDPSLVKVLLGLANVYRDRGAFQEAEPLYERAAALLRQTSGEEHPALVSIFESHAELLRASGRTIKARVMEKRARSQAEAFGIAF